jgi:hypothetical protein
MEQEPTTLTETVSRSNDSGPDPPVRPAAHSTSDLTRQLVTDDHVKDRAVQRWREPIYLTYSTYTALARSFFNWPQQLQKPSPDALSKKGFFYTGTFIFHSFTLRPIHIFIFTVPYCYFLHLSTGIGDKTICFHCCGSLVDWGCDDHPCSKHAAWFPYCVYVNYIRGPDFVRNCLLRERQLEYQYPCTVVYSTQSDTDDHLPI